jgi:hypothetical protein
MKLSPVGRLRLLAKDDANQVGLSVIGYGDFSGGLRSPIDLQSCYATTHAVRIFHPDVIVGRASSISELILTPTSRYAWAYCDPVAAKLESEH